MVVVVVGVVGFQVVAGMVDFQVIDFPTVVVEVVAATGVGTNGEAYVLFNMGT
ncbi:hypothetical protein MtrunA17_Chr1g0204381 [Medicago truncatula]|uniref:Uncharacterized protein n=1 Tax=Medicago truncatula TaxID=3880 RepID=A0A396JZ04_MEDTR|nr:hypothetical protein MtrunA17_Chr1g0204381 [Medicago truncatula]